MKDMKKKFSLSLLLSVCLAVGAGATPDWAGTLKQLQVPATRAKAMDKLREVVYELKDSKLRGQICAALIGQLRSSKQPAERRALAQLLESYLSHEKTPAIYFEKTEPLLLDSDPGVRHALWLAFYQQASQVHLSVAQEERLLKLIDHPNLEIRWEALNWANEASQNRQRVVGEPISKLGAVTLPIQLKLSRSDDKRLRNLAIYGCLQQFDFAPQQVALVAKEHLNDRDGGTRSLVLDFLQKYARRSAVLCQLQPTVLERFRQNPAAGDFPAVPDPELGPDASPPLTERYRLVETAAAMGALPPDAWTFLMKEAVGKVPAPLLADLARSQGVAGRPLLGRVLTPENLSEASDALAECGVPDEHLSMVLKELKAMEGKADDELARVATGLLLSLVDRPEALPVAEVYLGNPHISAQAAAAYLLARSAPAGPLSAKAAGSLQQAKWREAYQGTGILLAAVQRLRSSQPFEVGKLEVSNVDVNLLIQWLFGEKNSEKPQFLDDYARGSAINDRLEPRVGIDRLNIEMDWIAAHKSVVCEPGLRRLLYHVDGGVRAKAGSTLAALGLKV